MPVKVTKVSVNLEDPVCVGLRNLAWERRAELGGRASVSRLIATWVKEALRREEAGAASTR